MNFHQKLVVYYILNYFWVLVILDIASVLRARFIAGHLKAAHLYWFLMVVLVTICLWSASIVATCIVGHFALCHDLG